MIEQSKSNKKMAFLHYYDVDIKAVKRDGMVVFEYDADKCYKVIQDYMDCCRRTRSVYLDYMGLLESEKVVREMVKSVQYGE